jgi:S1-C subfamily serine protease
MSSASLRGLLCLGVAFAVFAGVGIWTYQQTKSPAAGKDLKTTAIAAVGSQPKPKNAAFRGNAPKPALPALEQPMPFHEPPRFFQKGGGRGFGRKTQRINLSDRLGVRLDKPSEDAVLQLGIAETDGLIVAYVRVGSHADSAGMKVGDILLTLDGRNVPSDLDQFHFQLEDLKTNQAIDAVILRDGKTETLKGLILPEAPQRPMPFQRRFFDN